MGVVLVMIISFAGVVGFSYKEAHAHKYLKQTQQQCKIKKQLIKRQPMKLKNNIAFLDGVEIRNLKG